VPGRKRKINPSFMPSLRVLKKDIRRKYTEMYINVLNNHDPALIFRFFQEFCLPNCDWLLRFPQNAIPTIRQHVGIPDMLVGLMLVHARMPDTVYSLGDVAIHVPFDNPSGGSRITGNLILKGTRLFQIVNSESQPPKFIRKSKNSSGMKNSRSSSQLLLIGNENILKQEGDSTSPDASGLETSAMIYHQELPSVSKLASGSATTNVVSPTQGIGDNIAIDLILLPNPIEVLMEAFFTMSLDDSNRIKSIQYHCYSFVENGLKMSEVNS
jgi:hypothetical protein